MSLNYAAAVAHRSGTFRRALFSNDGKSGLRESCTQGDRSTPSSLSGEPIRRKYLRMFRLETQFQKPSILSTKTAPRFETEGVAPRHGFEPRFTAPKAAVLPLDDRGSEGSKGLRLSVYHSPGAAKCGRRDTGVSVNTPVIIPNSC